jgi:hypothetical protein
LAIAASLARSALHAVRARPSLASGLDLPACDEVFEPVRADERAKGPLPLSLPRSENEKISGSVAQWRYFQDGNRQPVPDGGKAA